MTTILKTSKDGRFKVTTDDINPEVYYGEYKCDICRKWYDAEVMVFLNEGKGQCCPDCVVEEE